ncbi:TIGR03086 family metal-binding protein [Streptomyces sp. NPDC005899]|uniref:TIGR03086 family metal-binding protein n=1 Tax=Streptomyces sp. NPDC005899 TaxID=3155716 RepID=UPI0033D1CB79
MDTDSETAPAIDLEPAARRVRELAGAIGEDLMSHPTPCPDYAVRDLLAHVVGLAAAFRDAADKRFGASTDTPPGPGLPPLPDDWRESLGPLLDELVAAWRAPASRQGMTRAGGVELPGRVAAMVVQNELLVHGWDLARATGQSFRADEAGLRASQALLTPTGEGAPTESPFGPPIPVPPGAPLLDQVIALSGRRPDWRPGDGGGCHPDRGRPGPR